MKNTVCYIYFPLNRVILLAVTLSFLSGCIKNTLDGVEIVVNNIPAAAQLNFMITDANPQSQQQAPPGLKVTISGKDAGSLYEASGLSASKVVPVNGTFSLMLIDSRIPTPDKPVEFIVEASAQGFVPVRYPVTISDTGAFAYQIPMVNLTQTPAGVAAIQQSGVVLNAAGSTVAETIINTPVKVNKPENVQLQIPQGVVMRDAAGNVLTGNASVTMVHHDNRSFTSINAFPGGLFAPVAKINNQNVGPVTFETLGLVDLQITVGGKKVKTFSKPLLARVELNETSINPNNGKRLQVGDSLPIWSQDETNGEWTLEGKEIVKADATTGKLYTVMQITHLSPWNIDWFWFSWWWWRRNWNVCSSPSMVINSNESGWVYYELRDLNGMWIDWGTMYLNAGQNRRWFNAQNGRNARLYIYNFSSWWYTGNLIGQSNSFSLCGGTGNMTVSFPVTTTVNVSIQGNCPNSRIVRPFLYVYYMRPGAFWWDYLGTMYDGQLSTRQLTLGQRYQFGAYYGNSWYTYTHTVNNTLYREVMALKSTNAPCR